VRKWRSSDDSRVAGSLNAPTRMRVFVPREHLPRRNATSTDWHRNIPLASLQRLEALCNALHGGRCAEGSSSRSRWR
jgi:hypothetical protein